MGDHFLVGKKVKVVANDFLLNDLVATIAKCSIADQKLLLELESPITISGVTYSYLVASPRLSGDGVDAWSKDVPLGCAVTWVPQSVFNDQKPFDLGWWRGGAAAVADLVLQ